MSGVQFATVLTDTDGDPINDGGVLTAEQITALAASSDFASLRSQLSKFADKQRTQMTLARACEIALDAALVADKDEGLKPKMVRGRLIDRINEAAKSMTQLALEAENIAMLKERVGSIFTAASLVRKVCLMLDPAMNDD